MPSQEPLSQPALRIIDANLNRACEGLRVLEDIARLALNDITISRRLKTMRHDLVTGDLSFNIKLINARDSEHDVGADTRVSGQDEKKELPLAVVANSRRVQESLRTIEELAKTEDTTLNLNPEKFQQDRFSLYTVERELLSKLLRQDKKARIRGIHAIIDTEALAGRSHQEVARQIISGGAQAIQLRDKVSEKNELLAIAREMKALCAEHNVLFIMNDYLDLALAADADGLHIGQKDLPAGVARRLLPIDKILGLSTHSVREASAAEAVGADYIGIGSIYPTPTKETALIIGLERLRQVRKAVEIPLVAIGGITKDNVIDVISSGADSVAIISAILRAGSPQEATRQIADRIETLNEPTNR